MSYYEKLIKKMSQSMKEHPRSAMVMDMSSFQVVAKSHDIKSLSKKLPRGDKMAPAVVFQKPSEKASWIL